ncbi:MULTISPECIES: VOC family protein [Sphingomonas]|uniref:VOC family protein n=1 Tax=Sphingomonas TaxID=13687 RepID=UPI00082A6EEB|nr:VOC family protein [Sphingomonas sp. CCH10-B3]
MTANPIAYVEIPVMDLDRATAFYADLLGLDFERQTIDGYDMAMFPATEGAAGASGALVKGDVYVPGKTGAIVYFRVADIDAVLKRARARGAKILYDKKDVGAFGFVAEIEDSEGNRIALSAPK